jgi:DNA-binding MarR family transcriptional regulator
LEVYNFVSHWGNKDEESCHLYKYFSDLLESSLGELAKELKDKPNSEIIDIFLNVANRADILISFMNKTFSYLDFYYVKSKSTIKKLLVKALEIYKKKIFLPIQTQLTDEINKLIKEDRFGKMDNRLRIKKSLIIMKTMDLTTPKIYKENNAIIWDNEIKDENPDPPIQKNWFDLFMKDTEQFTSTKAMQDIQNRSTPEYVLTELKFLDEEKNRQEELLNELFLPRLNALIYEKIIGTNMKELVEMESGVKNMLENNKYNELTNLYELFKFYEPSLHEVAKVFRAYIEKRGNALRGDKEIYKDPKKMVPKLIDLQKEINSLVKECFKNNDILQSAKDRAFYEFMKTDYYSKQVAFFLDFCMRAGFKGKDAEAISNTLDDIIRLFKNLNTKYVFQKETEKKMSERLIKDATLSINNEKTFVSKLKQESDISLVNKMVGMLSDLDKNKQESENYRNTENKGLPNGIKFNVQVVSNGAWEIENKYMIEIALPPIFSSCVDDFKNYYLSKYREQNLIWYHGVSKLEIQYLYLQNKNISISTLPQVIILLELEKAGTMSIKNLSKNLKCDIGIIKNSIEGLIYNRTFNQKRQIDKGVLISTTAKNDNFNDNDEFKINEKFLCVNKKFNTIPLAKKKSEEEQKNEDKTTEEDYKRYRDYLIQSNLTRIMKSRIGQVTPHNWLVSETAKQIDRFKAQPQQIKDNIEKLIEKNYIKRDEKNKGCYEYVA